MGDLFANRKRVCVNDTLSISGAADFEKFPLLSALLAGIGNADGKTWQSPPHTLTLWLEGSILKFAAGSGDDQPKLFGTTGGLSEGLEGIEKALKDEHYEWKKPKGPQKAFTR